jgi:hypothetical protein
LHNLPDYEGWHLRFGQGVENVLGLAGDTHAYPLSLCLCLSAINLIKKISKKYTRKKKKSQMGL